MKSTNKFKAEKDVGKKIKEYTNDSLDLAVVCVATAQNLDIIDERLVHTAMIISQNF